MSLGRGGSSSTPCPTCSTPTSNFTAPLLVRWQSQKVIDQDLVALASQMEVIEKYGSDFSNTAVDVIHVFVESIRTALSEDQDPRALPDREVTVRFYV